MSPARLAGQNYVDRVNAGDLEGLVALFSPFATVLHPLGTFLGAGAVREFYAGNILPHRPSLTASGWVADDRICAFELEAVTAGRTSFAIDHCTVDADGLIERMVIGYR